MIHSGLADIPATAVFLSCRSPNVWSIVVWSRVRKERKKDKYSCCQRVHCKLRVFGSRLETLSGAWRYVRVLHQIALDTKRTCSIGFQCFVYGFQTTVNHENSPLSFLPRDLQLHGQKASDNLEYIPPMRNLRKIRHRTLIRQKS